MQNLFWGFVLVCFGIILLLENLGYADIGDIVSDFWPVALILLGANILMRHRAASREADMTAAGAEPADLIHASNVFGDVSVASSSVRFKGGSVSTLFGDARIDLSKIAVADGAHELRIHSVFGGSTLILPQGAPYAVSASTTFGSLSILGVRKGGLGSHLRVDSPSFAASPGRLTISISHMFGASRVEEAAPTA